MSSCAHEHSHEDDDDERGIKFNLYLKINTDQIECLNEAEEGSGKTVFKPWDDRLNRNKFVESDVDEELLINVPFTGLVKLKGIVLIGGEAGSHPKVLRLYSNKPHMSFDDVSEEAAQVFELARDETGLIEYPTKVTKFSSIHNLTIHIPENYGADCTKIYYIGLRGEFTEAKRDAVALATYESRPVPQDHKGEIPDSCRHEIF